MRSVRPALWLLAAALTLGGCDSPTEPAPEPIDLTGELTRGTQNLHDLPLADSGVLRIELLELTSTNLETGEMFDISGSSFLGFAIGRVEPDSEQECSATFATALGTANPLSVFLTPVERCVLVTDPGGVEPNGLIPEGFSWQYLVRFRSTE